MIFTATLSTISIMGVMIFIGLLLRINQPFTADIRAMIVKIIVNVGMPSIILSSVFNFEIDGEAVKLIIITFLFSVMLHIGFILMSRMGVRQLGYASREANEMALLSTLGNTGFIGIPLCLIVFGPKAALLAAIFDAGLDFVIWTVAVLFLQRKPAFNWRTLKAMINIPMMAIVIGITLGLLQFEAPSFLKDLTGRLAAIASPLAMIYIGLLIPVMWSRLRNISGIKLIIPLTLKLAIFPLLTTLLMLILPFDPLLKQVLVVLSAMPCFSLATVLFERYGADGGYGTAMVIGSTLLSLITIPLVVYLAL